MDFRSSKGRFIGEYANWKRAMYSDADYCELYGIYDADSRKREIDRTMFKIRKGLMTVDEAMRAIADI